MQTRNKVFDDFAQLMSNALGVAQGAKVEAETAVKGMVDRWLADRNFVTREEFDAVRAMAEKLHSARGVRVVVLPRCGHWTPIERPDECLRELREFLSAQR